LEEAANTSNIQSAKTLSNIAKNNYVTAINSQKLNEKVTTLNNQAAQLIQVNKNLQALIDAMLTNNENEGQIRLLIDGRQVTRVIKRREDNSAGQSTTGGDDD
jgi:ribonuclease HII